MQASQITHHSSLITLHSFCRRILRDHPFEAGVDPRFSIIAGARQRALAGPLLDELIETRKDDPIIRQLTEAMDADELRDAIFAFHRQARQADQSAIRNPQSAIRNDPAPFLEAFTRCYAEMLALNESPDDSLGPLVKETRLDLARVLEWAERLMHGEFDWKAFQLLRSFRAQFKPQAGNNETSRLIRAARDALTGFLDACLDRESLHWSEALIALANDFDRAYASMKAELGVLDFDDLLIKAQQLFESHPEIARRYPRMPNDVQDGHPKDIGPLISRTLKSLNCEVEIVCLPESYTAEERHITQSEFIVQRIVQLANEGIALEDIGILVRSAYDARHYERRLAEFGLEYRFVGSRPLSEAPGARDIITSLEATDKVVLPETLRSVLNRFADLSLTMPDGRQRYPNVRRLIELAENLDLPEFLAQVKELEITQTAERGIRIMPIHHACELPIIFIADTSHSFDLKPRLFAFDPDHGLATWVVNPTTGKFAIPLAHKEISEVVRDRQVSREQGTLHTALTRACDRLILVGCSNLRGDQGLPYRRIYSWSGWIEKALGLGAGSPEGENSVNGCRFTLSTDPPRSMRSDDLPIRHTLAKQFAAEFREGRPIEGLEILPSVKAAVERCLLPPMPIIPVITRISVSQALDYIECPARYRLLHVVGMPEEGGEPPDDMEETEVSAADLGHVVHDLLSRLDFSQDIRPQVQGHPLLEKFAESRWCKELQSADQVLKEVPFELPIGPIRPIRPIGKVLAGRMDVLYHAPKGWVVLDYKTGRAESRERYELQVGIYAHVTHQLIGEMPACTALVLLSTGEDWVQDTSDGSVAETASARLLEVCSSIDAGRFDPIPGKACDWCSFKYICKDPPCAPSVR